MTDNAQRYSEIDTLAGQLQGNHVYEGGFYGGGYSVHIPESDLREAAGSITFYDPQPSQFGGIPWGDLTPREQNVITSRIEAENDKIQENAMRAMRECADHMTDEADNQYRECGMSSDSAWRMDDERRAEAQRTQDNLEPRAHREATMSPEMVEWFVAGTLFLAALFFAVAR